MRNSKITMLCECAVMLALAFALSCAPLYEMPMGGSVTVASMLPIMLIGIKRGPAVGTGTAFTYSLLQALQALIKGNVFPYCETLALLILCVLLDYLVPFTVLGLSGCLKNVFKKWDMGIYVGIFCAVLLRFFSHFVVGFMIWGQWAPEGMGKFLYSFLYNAGFLSIDFAICLICAVILLRVGEIRSLLNLKPLPRLKAKDEK